MTGGGRIPADSIGKLDAWTLPTIDSQRVIKLSQGPRADKRRDVPPPGRKAVPGTAPPSRRGESETGAMKNEAGPARAPEAPVAEEQKTQAPETPETVSATPPVDPHDAGYEAGFTEGEAAGSEAGRKSGYEAGFAEGLAEGRAEAERRVLETTTARLDALAALESAWADRISAVERRIGEGLVELVSAVAEGVILGELAASPQKLAHIVGVALAELDGTDDVVIEMHASDLAELEDLASSPLAGLKLRESTTVAPGGCQVAGRAGSVDFRTSTRLNQCLRQVFAGEAIDVNEASLAAHALALEPMDDPDDA